MTRTRSNSTGAKATVTPQPARVADVRPAVFDAVHDSSSLADAGSGFVAPLFGADFSTVRLTSPVRLQRKLKVNAPGDQYEQEADRVADQVMRMPEPTVQRECKCGSKTGGGCEECKNDMVPKAVTKQVQRSSETNVSRADAPPIVQDVLREPGQPLDGGTRAFFETRFGADLRDVRVHTGGKAAESAEAVDARAYTVGDDIAFNAGRYAPHTATGRLLLAHELAHTQQQSIPGGQLQLGQRGDPAEDEARATARAVVQGQPVSDVTAEPPILRRDDGNAIDVELVPTTEEERQDLAKKGISLPTVSMETWFQEGGGWYESSLGMTAQKQSVKVYYFPGQTNERALVIGGVHGSELSGIEVAELLVEQLKIATAKPYYTVAVVPCLFPDNRKVAEASPAEIGSTSNVGRKTRTGTGKAMKEGKDPNREFPKLGQAFDPKAPQDAAGATIEAENVMLLELIDRFKPTRIASVHATRPEKGKPIAAGFFADPKTDEKGTALGVDDDAKLAIRMAERAKKGGAHVPGNALDKTPSAQYPEDPAFAAKGQAQKRTYKDGYSLGGWGTTAVAGGRPAMTVITVEVETSNPSLKPNDPKATRDQGRLDQLKATSMAIEEVFLGPP